MGNNSPDFRKTLFFSLDIGWFLLRFGQVVVPDHFQKTMYLFIGIKPLNTDLWIMEVKKALWNQCSVYTL